MSEKKPIIAITMGDPSGIGPEIIAKALSEEEIYRLCRPIVIGDSRVMVSAFNLTLKKMQLNAIETVRNTNFNNGLINILDLKNVDINSLQRGKVDPNSG